MRGRALGADSVWVPGYWAGNALTQLAYLAVADPVTDLERLLGLVAEVNAEAPG